MSAFEDWMDRRHPLVASAIAHLLVIVAFLALIAFLALLSAMSEPGGFWEWIGGA